MSKLIKLIEKLQEGDYRTLAQCITMVENELEDSEELLLSIQAKSGVRIVGITGPPGAGKSTLLNALLRYFVQNDKKIAVLSIDPSSPFNKGALLGDRIRMSEFYLHPNVYIRSLANRGALGGTSAKIIEVIDIVKACCFDYIFVETVGVGQSEVEIAGLADTTIVVMVPEAGDEIQTMKAGVMEIADIFVVNKADRNNADEFVRNLKYLAHTRQSDWEIPVLKCVATEDTGIGELAEAIEKHQLLLQHTNNRKIHLLSEKAYQLIQQQRMKDIDKRKLLTLIEQEIENPNFNLYRFVKNHERK